MDQNLLNQVWYNLADKGCFESLANFLYNRSDIITNIENSNINPNIHPSIANFKELQKTKKNQDLIPQIRALCYQLINEGNYN
jgi:hypothetical protein